MQDLFVLVADKAAEAALQKGLERNKALRIRKISFDIFTHPGRDGGVRKSGVDLLATKIKSFRHALMVLDFEGCGSELSTGLEVENELDILINSTWARRAKAIVADPEMDIWIWGSDNLLESKLEWDEEMPLREWLIQQGFKFDVNNKPERPKEALELVLRKTKIPRSSSLYGDICSRISLERCSDPSFNRLKAKLREWFPL